MPRRNKPVTKGSKLCLWGDWKSKNWLFLWDVSSTICALMQDVVFGLQEMLNNEPRNASEMVGYKYGLQVDRRHLLCLKPRSPTFQADSLSAEPQGKPKNTGVGSLALLQQILQTQELNWGLLHCRQILYQLSYQVKWSESRSVMSDSFRPQGLSSPWNSLGQNTGVGTPSLLQGIFPIQGSNPVSHIAGRFFTSWATREAQEYWNG